MLTKSIIAGIIIFIFILLTVPRYNRLRQLKNAVEERRSNVNVQLARRQKLILSIIRLVDIYMKYEIGAFSTIIEMRDRIKKEGAKNKVGGYALLALAEQYPRLKTNEVFIRLFRDLSDTEDKLVFSRKQLNEAIRLFNDERCTFPNILLLGWFFKKDEYFDFPLESEKPIVWPGPIAGYDNQ